MHDYTELEDEATVKPVLNGHSKADKTDNHLMQVKSIAECSGAFCNTLGLH